MVTGEGKKEGGVETAHKQIKERKKERTERKQTLDIILSDSFLLKEKNEDQREEISFLQSPLKSVKDLGH